MRMRIFTQLLFFVLLFYMGALLFGARPAVSSAPHLDANGQPVAASQKSINDLQVGDKILVPGKPLRRIVTSETASPDGAE